MQLPLPLTRDLVLIGGGHSHALVLRKWGMQPLPGVRLTVINPGPTAPYSGMLPGFVAGHYSRDELDIDLVRLARFANARLIAAPATGIDLAAKRISLLGVPDIRYDIASVDIGITSDMPDIPGFETHGIPAKPLGPFAHRWEAACTAISAGSQAPNLAVLGGGVAGAELALAMRHRMKTLGVASQVTLIDRSDVLSGVADGTRETLLRRIRKDGINIAEHAEVTRITATAVHLADGTEIASDFTVGTARAMPHGWLEHTGLATQDGFLTVDASLRSVTDPAVFAVGDCAHLSASPRPKAGVFAVRAAPVLYNNLRAAAGAGRLRDFKPQRNFLKLVSMGGKRAVADKSGLSVSGRLLWAWKDHIDRKFMRKFDDLPAMHAQDLPRNVADGVKDALGDKPLCAGCGAKVAQSSLSAALMSLPDSARTDVLTQPGDDAAVLQIGPQNVALTTDHLRAFSFDSAVFARITAVHALGDIWAMGAAPQAALASITLPPMSPELQSETLREILAASAEIFAAEGAEIVGGHTSIGAELTIGFTLTGLTTQTPITLAGAQPGDRLILTRPLGSGTLLAGEMRMAAKGADVLSALAEMQRPQGDAAKILHAAHAMTDVTGFGLAGHLMGMCDASGVGAELHLEQVPLYPGAEALAAAGVRSSLYPSNRQVASRMTLPDTAAATLLFDPQTSGGLLASVAPEQAEALLAALRGAGHRAAIIGDIHAGPPFITVV